MNTNEFLKIKFQKYNIVFDPSQKNSEAKEFQVNALGYYDVIEFNSEKDILDFKPSKDVHQQVDESDCEFKTEYVLKLLKIDGEDDSAEFWRKNGGVKYPFIAVVSVDVNDAFISKSDNIDLLFKNIKNTLKKVKVASGFSDYASFYFCLGYTDIVVILQSFSLSAMNEYVEKLREAKIKGKNVSFASSTYTVFGIVRSKDKKEFSFGESDGDKSIGLHIKWAFKDIQACNSQSQGGFFNKLNKLYKGNFQTEYGVFDRSCKIECTAKEIYDLFNDEDKDDNPYASNSRGIKIFNTKMNFGDTSESETVPVVPQGDGNINDGNVKKELAEFLEEYSGLIKVNHLHKRLFTAMKNMEGFYALIITSEHSGDIKRIVGDFYEKTLVSFKKVVLHLKNITDNERVMLTEYFEKALEKFRNCVQFLLFDILRSDHSYFEVPSIAHPSIGSTTKLLLAYNNIVNDWNRMFPNCNNWQKSGLTFLVTSGGSDTTHVSNLLYKFEDFISKSSDVYLPIIITIPEASLYDVKGTVSRLAHEFFHLKGNRLRKGNVEKKVLGRYTHFFNGMLYEYIDFCLSELARKDEQRKENKNSSSNNKIVKDLKEAIKNLPFFYTAKDNESDFYYEEQDLKSGGISNYATIAGRELEKILFSASEGMDNIYTIIGECIRRLSQSYNKDLNEVSDELSEQYIVNDLEKKLKEECAKWGDELSFSEWQKYVKENFDRAFFNYYNVSWDAAKLFESLHNTVFSLPFNAKSYACQRSKDVPPNIVLLSKLVSEVIYKSFKDDRAEMVERLGLNYISEFEGLDEYNVDRTSVSRGKLVAPMVDYYSREWCNASLKFFLGDSRQISDRRKSMDFVNYKNLLQEMYKECYADLCSLCLKEEIYKNCELDGDDGKFRIFTEYVGAFLSEKLDMDRLFGNENDDSVDPRIALRICAVYETFVGVIEYGQGKTKILADYLVKQYQSVNGLDLSEEEKSDKLNKTHKKIVNMYKTYIKLRQKKMYVKELVDYLKSCKEYAFEDVNFDNLACVEKEQEELNWAIDNWEKIYYGDKRS